MKTFQSVARMALKFEFTLCGHAIHYSPIVLTNLNFTSFVIRDLIWDNLMNGNRVVC